MSVILRKLGNVEREIDGSTFIIRILDAEEEAKIQDELFQVNEDNKIKVSMSSTSLALAMKALIGWKGVMDADGNEVEFHKSKIKVLPNSVLTKIGEIAKGEQLPAEEEKN